MATSLSSTVAVLSPITMDDVTGTIGSHGDNIGVTMTTIYDILSVEPFTSENGTTTTVDPSARYFRTQPSRILQLGTILILDLGCLSGNCLLILTIYRCRELRTISNLLILNLAAIGILLSLMVLPTWAATSWSQYLHFSGVLCQISAMLMYLLFLEAILTLGGVAVDRYGNICHPFRYAMLMTTWKAVLFIVTSWIISIVFSVLPLVGFGRYAFLISEVSICTIDFSHDIYFSLLTVCLVVGPACFTICICYWRIFTVARNQARKVRNLETSIAQNNPTLNKENNVANGSSGPSKLQVPGLPHTSVSTSTPNSPLPRPRHKLWQIAAKTVKNSVKQSRAFRTVFTIIGCFLVCWTPYIVLIFYDIVSKKKPFHALEFVITYLALANYVANPVICVTMNKEFRKGVRKVFGLHRKRLLEDVISAWTSTALQLARGASRAGSRRGSKVGSKSESKAGSREGSRAGSRKNSDANPASGGIPIPGKEAYTNNDD